MSGQKRVTIQLCKQGIQCDKYVKIVRTVNGGIHFDNMKKVQEYTIKYKLLSIQCYNYEIK